MALTTVAISSLVIAIALRGYLLLSGWNADPAFLFGLITPFVVLPLAAYSVIIAPLSILWILLKRSSGLPIRGRMLAAVIVCLAAVIAAPAPFMPGGSDAFEWRMMSFSQAEFQQLALDVRAELAGLGLDELRGDRDATHSQILGSLRERHAVLRIGTFSPELFARDSHVSIEWAGGLTGGYAVSIVDGDGKPDWLPAPNIYSDVAAYTR